MNIVRFEAENFKRIKLVRIDPKGNLITIAGDNNQGKSSVIDAILAAIENTFPSEPIRRGTDKATIKLDLGEMKVQRVYEKRPDGSLKDTLDFRFADGVKVQKPETVLKSLIGALSFDPMAFLDMKLQDQFEAAKKLVPDVKFDEIEAKNKEAYDKRTLVNRDLDSAKKRAEAIPVPEVTPKEKVDVSAVFAELEKISAKNNEIDAAHRARQRVESDLAELLTQIETLTARADSMKAQLDVVIPERTDTTELKAKLDNAKAINDAYDQATLRKSLLDEVAQKTAESEALSKEIDDRKAAMRKAISDAKLPVEGLEFGDGVVLLNGLPLDQASTSQQIQTSVAIAAALNPKLKVIFVREGSLMSEKTREIFKAYAEKAGLQIWEERVDTSGKVGIVLEDGEVVAVNEEKKQGAA